MAKRQLVGKVALTRAQAVALLDAAAVKGPADVRDLVGGWVATCIRKADGTPAHGVYPSESIAFSDVQVPVKGLISGIAKRLGVAEGEGFVTRLGSTGACGTRLWPYVTFGKKPEKSAANEEF